MRELSVTGLFKPFDAYYRHGRWDLYAQSLEEQGPVWLLELHLPRVGLHVQPLLHVASLIAWTPRLRFLVDLSESALSSESLEQHWDSFERIGDLTAAAAVNCMAVMSIWHNGQALGQMKLWDDRAGGLLQDQSQSRLCSAALITSRSIISLVARADVDAVLELTSRAMEQVGAADSPSLLMQITSLRCMALLLNGDFAALELLLEDATSFIEQDEVSQLVASQLHVVALLKDLALEVQKEGPAGLDQKVLGLGLKFLPPIVDVLHREPTVVSSPRDALSGQIDHPSQRISQQDLWAENHYACAWSHFFCGMSFFRLGNPHKAMAHAQAGISSAIKSEGPLVEMLAHMPLIQSLIDLRRNEEAESMLRTWIDQWREKGLRYFAACGAVEMAGLLLARGDQDQAARLVNFAKDLTPMGRDLHVVNRPSNYMNAVCRKLHPDILELTAWKGPESAALFIQTLGGFRVFARGQVLHERKWRSMRTKMFLKALIVLGGEKVHRDQLLDLLWPDVDGDMAATSLKVTISRLRKTVAEAQGQCMHWLEVKDNHISLVKSSCGVDCLRFQEALHAAMRTECAADDLARTLDMYTGDFLPADPTEAYIDRRRRQLRNDFVQGVLHLARLRLQADQADQALDYLHRVQDMPGINEQVFALLMQTYLHLGYPSMAIQVFQQARLRLKEEYDALPGPTLLSLVRQARDRE